MKLLSIKKSYQRPLLFSLLGVLLLSAVLWGLFSWQTATEDALSDITPADTTPLGTVRILVAARDRAVGLSDVMMLLSLDRDRGSLSVMQIPRDTYVNFKDGSYRKINGAPAALGGMAAFRDAMEETLSLSIDHYVRLSADAFQKGVDALGGIEIELAEPMDYEDPAQGLSIHLPRGKQTLNGREAEWFVRYRADYLEGDLGRMDAQKIFLAALAKKALNGRSPLKLVRLAGVMLSDVETDLALSDLWMLAMAAMDLSEETILFATAPGEAAQASDGGSYYVLSAKGTDRLLCEHFGKTEGNFDPQTRFLNQRNEIFQRIYESDAPYRLYSAQEIGREGISISRT